MFWKDKWDDVKLIEAMRAGGPACEKANHFLFSENELKIKALVRPFGCDQVFANDLLHDGITELWKNIMLGKFRFQASIHTYLNAICKRILLQTFRTLGKIDFVESLEKLELESDGILTDFQTPELLLLNAEQKEVLEMLLNETSETCRKVLKMSSHGFSMKAIAEAMGYKSEEVGWNRKSLCLESLRKKIDQKPHLQKIIAEMGWKKYPKK
jgi:RNA polymerase sigma factor (sigma-70 family)